MRRLSCTGQAVRASKRNHLSVIITSFLILISLFSAGHALLNKREPRAALGWIILSVAVPLFGPLLYLLLGINRLRALGEGWKSAQITGASNVDADSLNHPLDMVTAKLSRYPCTRDNDVQLLRNGEEAYPKMLAAIGAAKHSVYLSTYIFDSDDIGRQFAAALSECVCRGVQVRVLIDSVGSLYSFPSAVRLLRRSGVSTSRFLPLMHRNSWLLNMRNHRKILAIDGCLAFAGGMNIGARHMVGRHRAGSAADVQFLIEGPAARSIADIFCRDWKFATKESLTVSDVSCTTRGKSPCRPISDGPGDDIGTLPRLLLGLIGSATKSVTIVTPYFLPPPPFVGALIGASLRGVRIQILLPKKNNLPYVKWASEHAMAELLRSPIEIYYQPEPFSHTKLLLIDDDFLQIGSYNMDARSLRLNFELAVNIYDRDLRRRIDIGLSEKISCSQRIEHQYLTDFSLPIRIRNATAWLFTPYL